MDNVIVTMPHSFDKPVIDEPNHREYWVLGYRHRADGPAVEKNGRYEFWYYGVRHRLDTWKPTLILPDGSFVFHTCGQIHNVKDPAVILKTNRIIAWYQHGVLHADGFPAFIKKLKNGSFLMVWAKYGFIPITHIMAIIGKRLCIINDKGHIKAVKKHQDVDYWNRWAERAFETYMKIDPKKDLNALKVEVRTKEDPYIKGICRFASWVNLIDRTKNKIY